MHFVVIIYYHMETCTLTFLLKHKRIYLCVRVIGCLIVKGLEGFSYEWAFKRTSRSLFGNMVWLSFMWLLVMYSAYMWYLSRVDFSVVS